MSIFDDKIKQEAQRLMGPLEKKIDILIKTVEDNTHALKENTEALKNK